MEKQVQSQVDVKAAIAKGENWYKQYVVEMQSRQPKDIPRK